MQLSLREAATKQSMHDLPMRSDGLLRCARMTVIGRNFIAGVIARSGSDEAVHAYRCGAMDCFAPLAMTVMERNFIAGVIARSGSDEAIHG